MQPEALVRKSFYAFQRAAAVPAVHAERAALLERAAALYREAGLEGGLEGGQEGGGRGALPQLLAARHSRRRLEAEAQSLALVPRYSLRFLQPGRLAQVRVPRAGGGAEERGWGVVLSFRRWSSIGALGLAERPLTQDLAGGLTAEEVVVDMLLLCAAGAEATATGTDGAAGAVPPAAPIDDPTAELHVIPVSLVCVCCLSAARLWLPPDLSSPRARRLALEGLRQLVGAKGRLPTAAAQERAALHPVRDLGASDCEECTQLLAQADGLRAREASLHDELAAADAAAAVTPAAAVDDEAGSAAAAPATAPPLGIEARLECLERARALELEADECLRRTVALSSDEFAEQMVRMQRVLHRLGTRAAHSDVWRGEVGLRTAGTPRQATSLPTTWCRSRAAPPRRSRRRTSCWFPSWCWAVPSTS
jgi:hypothetical protein